MSKVITCIAIRKIIQTTILLLIAIFFLWGLSGQVAAIELTLEQALEMSMTKSPTIINTRLNLERSERNLWAQQASLKSQFNLTVTPFRFSKDRVFDDRFSQYYTIEQTSSAARLSILQPIKWTDGTLRIVEDFDWRESSSSLTGTVKDRSYRNSLYLSLNQPLFTYNRTQMRIKELELALENAQLNFAIQRLQIERQVTQEFLNLYFRQRSVEISKEELTNATESYEIIKSKVEAGISAEEELFQADLTQANSRASLENSQIQFENSLDNFKILLGMSLDEDLQVLANIEKLLVDVDLMKALNYGLQNRMELRQRDIDIQYALDDLIRAGSENEFLASVDLTYGIVGTDSLFGDIYRSPTRNQMVEIRLNIPLFDWGKKKHQMESSRKRVEQQRISADEEQKQIKYQIRQAYRNLLNQNTQIEIAEKNVVNARRTYEINLERYRNGDLSSKDIEFYQNQLSREQLNEIAALINYQVALLDLKIRSLWDFSKNQPVIALQ
ncbi:MAG: TolC family protein [candidate division Zixibacteria bacterium]